MNQRTRSRRALTADERIRRACERMLEANERLTARAVARSAGIGAASSITRDPIRREILDHFKREQDVRIGWMKRIKKQSEAQTQKLIEQQAAKASQLSHIVQLLIASHKAALMAVDAIGGTREWLRFFKAYRDGALVDALGAVDAIPEGLVLPAPPPRLQR